MNRPVRITPLAEGDIAAAQDDYEGREPGLGNRFIEQVRNTLTRIVQNPFQHQIIKGTRDHRRAPMHQFPFGIWYRVEPDESVVVACLAHRRDLWLARRRTICFVAGTVRRNQLDSLRFLAISAVLFDHCVKPLWFAPGGVAVRLFLLISGFLITRTFVGKDQRQRGDSARLLVSFYGRRSLRIWPLFYALLIVLLVTASISRQQFVYHGLFLTNLLQARSGDFDHPWFLAHLWTLSVQEQFYLVWPVLCLALTQSARLRVILLAITTAVLFRAIMWATGHTGVAFDVLPFASFDALGFGALLAAFPRLISDDVRTAPIIIGSSLICFALALSGIEFLSLVVVPTLWLVPLVLLTRMVFAGISGPIGKLLELPPLIFLGRISLGIYLLHLPVWYGLTVLPEGWSSQSIVRPGWPAFLVVSAVTFLMAGVSWYVLENPLQRLRKYLTYEDATAKAKLAAQGS